MGRHNDDRSGCVSVRELVARAISAGDVLYLAWPETDHDEVEVPDQRDGGFPTGVLPRLTNG
ncbi:hypothetical protein [Umezawaea beigongshangensis]|uniref:hypothetical protein n=1 Tax=Umezawaea beigongshangensis TaxID=2780383 RepID=UPI0018F26D39|nr:hypothetical protein [Umezawaea beigongshangensis]